MNIIGNIVTLRAIQRSDMQLICDMFNDPELEDAVVGWAFPLSIDQQNKWFDNHIGDTNNFRFIIETPSDGAIGIATLTEIDWKNRHASHGIKLVNKHFHAKGIGTDAVMAIMRYSFDQLGLQRLDGSWFDNNIPSIKLYTKCGWSVEGKKREYIYKNGEWRDLNIVGITKSDYQQLVKQNHYWEIDKKQKNNDI